MEVDKLICNVIEHEMSTPSGRIVVKNQNWKPPSDSSYYIVVGVNNPKILSNISKFDYENDLEIKTVVTYTKVNIDITSKNREAVKRKEEIIMALNSIYSVQQQEFYQMKIFRDANVLDLSFIEGSSALNRFRISCIVSSIRRKETNMSTLTDGDYFNKFRRQEVIEQ